MFAFRALLHHCCGGGDVAVVDVVAARSQEVAAVDDVTDGDGSDDVVEYIVDHQLQRGRLMYKVRSCFGIVVGALRWC